MSTSAHRPVSTCLSVFNLSIYHLSVHHTSVDLIGCQSDCLRFFSPPHPPLVDSLDSELWYHFGCRAAALASATPRPLGSLFGSFHHAERAPRVISSLTAESPTIRSFKTSLASIQGFSPPVSCAQGRLVNEVHAHEIHTREKVPFEWRQKAIIRFELRLVIESGEGYPRRHSASPVLDSHCKMKQGLNSAQLV